MFMHFAYMFNIQILIQSQYLFLEKMQPLTNLESLKTALVSILLKTKNADVVEDEESLNKLLQHLSSTQFQDLHQFTECLQKDCGLVPKTILDVLNWLIKSEARAMLGQRILRSWLLFKILEFLDILKKVEKQKRKLVSDVFGSFTFNQKKIENLVKACYQAIGIAFQQADVKDIVDALTKQNSLVGQLFENPKIQLIQYNPNKSIEEQLTDLISDFMAMPQKSFEKTLQKELIFAHIQKNQSGNEILKRLLPNLISSISSIRSQYQQQFRSVPLQIEEIFKKVQNGSEANIYQTLCCLKSKLFYINALQLKRLIQKTAESEKQIYRKEVILFIGGTGSGKSTVILKCLGYNLKAGRYNNLSTLVPIEQLKNQHKTFYTSPEAKSCTRYINAVPVPDSMYPIGTSRLKKNLVLCDSPGFGDTAGIQVDIANGVGMINALNQTSSVRMVVILPYDSLTSERMSGTIKISQTVSSLFHQLTVVNSIAVLFNRVPKDKIPQIPTMIANKIANLTQVQKSNQKLQIFLNRILSSSKDIENFIDPLRGNFFTIFQKIQSMPPITQVKKFQYKFTDATTKDIENFANNQRNLVKDYCQNGKLEHSCFHFKNLRQLRSVLKNNSKLQQCYTQLSLFIQQASARELNFYQELIKSIINYQSNNKEKLQEVTGKIRQFYRLFKQFKDLKLVSDEDTNKIVQQKKKIIQNQFQNILDVSQQTIDTVKIFSKELDPKFQKVIFEKLDGAFKEIHSKIQKELKNKIYDTQLPKKIQDLRHLERLIQRMNDTVKKEKEIEKLRKILLQEVTQGFTILSEVEKQEFLKESLVNQANQKIQSIQNIIDLAFLDKNDQTKKEFAQKLKNIQSKCKKNIRQIENLNVSLQNSIIASSELGNRKKQIQLLLQIKYENNQQILKKDFQFALKNIKNKINENEELLKNIILSLRQKKSDELQKNLNKIKKAIQNLIQYSNILGNAEEQNFLVDNVYQELSQYFKGQFQLIKKQQLRLGCITQQKITKIRIFYDKISFYDKIKSVNNKNINQLLQFGRIEFYQKLKGPYLQFKPLLVGCIQDRKHYKNLLSYLQKIENLSFFSMSIAQILGKDYEKINQEEIKVIQLLQLCFKLIDEDFVKFINFQIKSLQPQTYLKQLVKTLLSFNQKHRSTIFILNKLNFQIHSKILSIEEKLEQVKSHCQKLFQNDKNAYTLKQIIQNCRFYSEIDDIYRQKYQIEKFCFKDLHKSCQQLHKTNLKTDEDYVISLIIGTKPSNIQFDNLKEYYEKFSSFKNVEGDKKKKIITSQLGKIEKNYLDQLARNKKEIEDINFMENRSKIMEIFQCCSQARELQKGMRKIYTQAQDIKLIKLNLSIVRNITNKISQFFENQLHIIIKQLADYDFISARQKLKAFSYLQKRLIDLAEEQLQFSNLVKKKSEQIKLLVQNHQYIKQQIKKDKLISKKIQQLIEILKKGYQNQIEQKYYKDFILDQNFLKYYSNNGDIIQQNLKLRIKLYFDNHFEKLSDLFENQSDQIAEKQNDNIENLLKFLPPKLKIQYTKTFNSLIKQFQQKKRVQIQLFMKKAAQSQKSLKYLNLLFQNVEKTFNKKQFKYSQKWVEKLQFYLRFYQQKCEKIQEKINLIQFLSELCLQHEGYLKQNLKIQQFIKQNITSMNQSLKKFAENQLSKLKVFLKSNQIKNTKIATSQNQSNETIFQLYSFIEKLNNNKLLEEIKKQFEQQVNKIIKEYLQIFDKRPDYKLYSQQIIEPNMKKEVQTYIISIKLKINVLNQIKKMANCKAMNNLFDKCELYNSILISYNNQVKKMISIIKEYNFLENRKRNMTQYEIQHDLNQLKKVYMILQKRQLFFKQHVIIEKEDFYDLTKINNAIISKFQNDIMLTKLEIKQLFTSYKSQNSIKIHLLLSQLKIMKKKENSLQFFTFSFINQTISLITNEISNQFSVIKKACLEELQNLKRQYQKSNQQIKNEQKHGNFNKESLKTKHSIQELMLSKGKKQLEKRKGQFGDDEFYKMATNTLDALTQIQVKRKELQKSSLQNMIYQKINDLQNGIKIKADVFVEKLMIFQRALLEQIDQTNKYNDYYQEIIEKIKKFNVQLFNLIQTKLETYPQDDKSIGKNIARMISNKDNNIYFKSQHQKQNINYVLQNLQKINLEGRQKIKPQKIKQLQAYYDLYKENYQKYKCRYKKNPTEQNIDYMITQLKDLGKIIIQKQGRTYQYKIQLLAGIFAILVIINSQNHEGIVNFTIQIHPSQIITIILLLGICQEQVVSSRLAQVGTGEGKSIILAVLSCYFVLIEYKVANVCYSPYLSQRDYLTFKKLFQKLGVTDSLKYKTFNQLCKSILNNQRQNIQNYILNNLFKSNKGFLSTITNILYGCFSYIRNIFFSSEKQILLIDQADIFVQDRFFGNTFQLYISLRDEAVTKLIYHVWNKVSVQGNKVDIKSIKQSSQFEDLIKKYPMLEELLQNQLHGMISGALNYKYHYKIINNKITNKYQCQENDLHYGYKTIFANIFQFKKGKISHLNLNQSLTIRLKIAQFSYASMPKYFENILGVTGTLQMLPLNKKQILKDQYQIKDQYAIPSPFGVNYKRKENYFVVSNQSYFLKIITRITLVENNRPILIFFKGPLQINQFYSCILYQPYVKKTNILTMQHDKSLINTNILKAVFRGNITLITKQFGRGTDFLILDEKLKQQGGLHVIQTFLSLDDSEELQIKGRTARQNSNGSYDCIINQNELQMLGLKGSDISGSQSSELIHEKIKKGRAQRYQKNTLNIIKRLQCAEQKHKKSSQLYKNEKLDQTSFINYITMINCYPQFKNNVTKIVLAFDATGSMQSIIINASQFIDNIFSQSKRVLKQQQIQAMIEVQILLYRNYNSPFEQLLEGTPFQSNGQNLKKFMSYAKFKGMRGNEALQVLFQQINKQKQIDSVILVGDAPPNTVQQVKQKRSWRGEQYWEQNGFPITNINTQLDIFMVNHKNCQVNCFYLNQNFESFKEISDRTKGICKVAKYSKQNIAQLQSFIITNILKTLKDKAGKDLKNSQRTQEMI